MNEKQKRPTLPQGELVPQQTGQAATRKKNQEQTSWRDFHEVYENAPDRLGGQNGYRLFDGSHTPSLSDSPRLKPGVELILGELEKPSPERNQSVIDAGRVMLSGELVTKLGELPDDASRIILLKAYDLRFGVLPEDLSRDAIQIILPMDRPTEDLQYGGRGRLLKDSFKIKLKNYVNAHPEFNLDQRLLACRDGSKDLRDLCNELIRAVLEDSVPTKGEKLKAYEFLRDRRRSLKRNPS